MYSCGRINLCCPECKASVIAEDGSLRCSKCQRIFRVVNGIPSFIPDGSAYEGRWAAPHLYTEGMACRMKSWFVPGLRFMTRCMKRKGSVLDLGCGGGNAFYKALGPVAGIDVSLESLARANDIYDLVAHADAAKLPFADETFDYVVSWDLIGHIPERDKTKVISEICRVLKRGGLSIHYIETYGNDPVETFARKYPDLYNEHFIRKDGHFGLETPEEVLARFDESRFRLIMKKPQAFMGLRYPKEYLKRFDNEYKQKSFPISVLAAFCRLITKIKIFEYLFEVIVVFCEGIFAGFFPFDDASGIYVCHQKRRHNICMISGAYPPLKDGIGDYTFKLLENLKKYGFQTTLVTSRDAGVAPAVKTKERLDILAIIERWDISAVRTIFRLIKEEEFEIVHIQYPSVLYQRTLAFTFLPLLIMVFFRSTKAIVTLHEFSIARPVNKLKQLLLALSSHRLIVTEKKDFDEMDRILPAAERKMRVIPIGSNIGVYGCGPGDREGYLKGLGLGRKARIVSFFGVIHYNKGLECLLRAISMALKNGSPMGLIIIAHFDPDNNPYHGRIRELISSLNLGKSVFLTGYVPPEEVSRFISISDFCVLPFTDGVTLRRGTLMAAIAHSKAVISTRPAGYVPHQLIDNENIFLTPVNDVQKMAEAIELLCGNDKLREKIALGAGRLAKEFSWDKIAAAHKMLYHDAAGRG